MLVLKKFSFINRIEEAVFPLTQQIEKHPLFNSMNSVADLKVFSEHHVFAVWDFMCLMKKLQSKITCITVPWFPPVNSLGARLINEIVTEEESDVSIDHRYLSHFELYIEAMQECGANTASIQQFLANLKSSQSLVQAFRNAKIPMPARTFVNTTFEILKLDTHQLIAAFVFGRESITDKMFAPIVNYLNQAGAQDTKKFQHYFQRHIDLEIGRAHV